MTMDEEAADAQAIIESGAHMVFVGLGCPRQERWMFGQRDRLQIPIVCVGAAFDFWSGAVAGTWRLDGGRIRTEPFERLSRETRAELREEAGRLAPFHA